MGTIIRELTAQEWARPIINDINANGGLTHANKTRFFELRFGYALHQAGIAPRYEIAGVGASTLDFGFTSDGQRWRVELMRLEETAAVQRATHAHVDADGIPWSGRVLSSNAEDRRESEEGETLKAVQRICQKCERDGQPHKFPPPDGAYHAILVDFRTFLNGGDAYDRVHVGLGGEFVPEAFCRRYWEGQLIAGVFSPRNPLRGAPEARQRVHFIGFVKEDAYQSGGFRPATQFVGNPNLFSDADAVDAAIGTWPLQPIRVLNGGHEE